MGTCFSKMNSTDKNSEPKNFYNLLLSQILQVMMKLQEGDKNWVCCNRVIAQVSENAKMPLMTWEDYQKIYGILGQLMKDLKTVMITHISRDMKYRVETTMKELKGFLSHEDYVEALEKMVKYRNGGPKAFYDVCTCGKCFIDVPDKKTEVACDCGKYHGLVSNDSSDID